MVCAANTCQSPHLSREKDFPMIKQDNTKKESFSKKPIVRVVCIKLVTSRFNVLQFIPSAYLPEVVTLLEQADEVELRLKIDN